MADDEIQAQVDAIVVAANQAVGQVMHTEGLPDLTWLISGNQDPCHSIDDIVRTAPFDGMGVLAEVEPWVARYGLTEVESLWLGQREWKGTVGSRRVRVWTVTDPEVREAAVRKWIDDLNAQALLRKETDRG